MGRSLNRRGRQESILRWTIVLWVLLAPASLFSSDPDAQARFETVKEEMTRFRKEQGPYRLRLFEEKNPKAMKAQPASVRKQRSQYLSLIREMDFWGHAADLKRELVLNYESHRGHSSQSERASVNEEANRLALALIRGIGELKDRYNIHTFPIVHNLFIQTGLSKRGACKHWAEDLLGVINGVKREHFVGYWAEAHAGSMREHNVAALVPAGVPFEEGLLIDPWRTAGKPYWSLIKKDHYPWQPWSGYHPR